MAFFLYSDFLTPRKISFLKITNLKKKPKMDQRLTPEERLENAIYGIFDRTGCNCPGCVAELGGSELFHMSYEIVGPEGFETGERENVFNFSGSSLTRFLNFPRIPFPSMIMEYARHVSHRDCCPVNRHLKFNIYRKTPLNWTTFRSISVMQVAKPNSPANFQESGDPQYLWNVDFSESRQYNSRLKMNIKLAYLFSHLKLQKKMTGFFKPPLVDRMQFEGEWYHRQNWDWLDSSSSSLRTWTTELNRQTLSHGQRVLKEMRERVSRFYENQRLQSVSYWLYDRDLPYTYIEKLKIYAGLVNKMFCICYNINLKIHEKLQKSEGDLAGLMEQIIDSENGRPVVKEISVPQIMDRNECCFICMDDSRNTHMWAYIPCGHALYLCSTCALPARTCPIRCQTDSMKRLYLQTHV